MIKSVKRPIIGITTYGRDQSGNFYLPGEYVDAVRNAGGLPVLLTPGESNIAQITELVNGIIFAGGGDIDPSEYSGVAHPSISRMDPERDKFELQLARHILQEEVPVLGICRGIQVLNVATNGDLIVHIPDEIINSIKHRSDEGESIEHKVQIQSDSRLARIIGKREISVVSKHHQGICNISSDWNIVAKAVDGIIEALEHKTHPWMIAVQWHPEFSLEDPNHQNLFLAFVEATQKD